MCALVLMAGCAGPAYPEAVPSSPPTTPAAPAASTAPPRGPTDLIKKTGIVVGTVTRGGAGPCYGLSTDDGTEYAVHAPTAGTLTRGDRVRVYVKPSTAPPDCRPGRPIEANLIETLF